MASLVMETRATTALVTQGKHRGRMPMAATAESGASTCPCGQALECCHTAHCPRCGVTLPA